MKRTLILLCLIICWSHDIFGQYDRYPQWESGIMLSPMLTYLASRRSTFNYAVGSYSHASFGKRLGVGMGLIYQRQDLSMGMLRPCNPFSPTDLCYYPDRLQVDMLKIPIWMSIRFTQRPDAQLLFRIIGGYGPGIVLRSRFRETPGMFSGMLRIRHHGLVGFEFQVRLRNDIRLTISPQVEATKMLERDSRDLNNIHLVLRIGR